VWVNTLAADHAAGHVDDQNLPTRMPIGDI